MKTMENRDKDNVIQLLEAEFEYNRLSIRALYEQSKAFREIGEDYMLCLKEIQVLK